MCRAPPGKRSVKICGVQRVAVVAAFLSIGLLLLYYSAAHLTILWATLTGAPAGKLPHDSAATLCEGLGSPVYYLASHEIDAQRHSLFFSFLFLKAFCQAGTCQDIGLQGILCCGTSQSMPMCVQSMSRSCLVLDTGP